MSPPSTLPPANSPLHANLSPPSSWPARGGLPLLLLCLGAGCQRESASLERSAQITAYTAALEGLDADACAALTDSSLRGDCLTATAIHLAGNKETAAAHAACARFPSDQEDSALWRDECFFQIVDAAELRGAVALAACQEAGRFTNQCASHVAARAVEEDILRYAQPGNELLIHRQVFSTLRRYMDASMAEVMAQDMVTRWIAQRLPPEGPFDPQACGQLGIEMCARVYERMVRGPEGMHDTNAAWRQGCRSSLSVGMARQYGLPSWEPGAEQMVQQAWYLLCSM